ncbi:MAG: glycosyltransferase [Ignavibacteriales bacterium]|nr:glycosyltransferase [Ignavibacteriales bacterium]
MPLPKISIITPSFNQARFIDANIQSVLNQQYPNVEHIIIDGGSTDGTVDVLKKYPHLRWISKKDRGQSDALNKGFKLAAGDIIGWLNSDDTYCPYIFPIVADYFKNEDVKVICGDGYEIDSSGIVIKQMYSRSASPDILIKYWKWKLEFIQPAFFFRREVFDKVGFLDEDLYFTMDFDFFIRLGQRYKFHYCQIPFANFRLYTESKTGKNYRKIIPDYIWEMQKVSHRYWGKPYQIKYYEYLFSFIGALFYSVVKNLFFSPTSKSRALIKRFYGY